MRGFFGLYTRRAFLAFVVLGLVYVGWWWAALVYALVLMYLCVPYELILVGVLVDVHFTGGLYSPWYTIAGSVLVIARIVIAPHIIGYKNSI